MLIPIIPPPIKGWLALCVFEYYTKNIAVLPAGYTAMFFNLIYFHKLADHRFRPLQIEHPALP